MLDIIGQLYDAAADLTAWPTMAAKMAALFGAESCMLHVADLCAAGTRFLGVTDNFQASFWSDYGQHYYREDQWIKGIFEMRDVAHLGEELAHDDWYKNSAFLNEFSVSAGVHYLLGASASMGDEKLGLVGIHRPQNGSGFGQEDRRRLNILLPHFARAAELNLRFESARLDRSASLEGLERTGMATFVVDRVGRIAFASRLAEALIAEAGPVPAQGGRLTCDDPRTAGQLGKLVQSAVVGRRA